MKKPIKIALIILAAPIVLLVVFNIYDFFVKDRLEVYKYSGYYRELAKDCPEITGCCLASVKTMSDNNFILMPAEGCPDGYNSNMYKCLGSYKWCEPGFKSSETATGKLFDCLSEAEFFLDEAGLYEHSFNNKDDYLDWCQDCVSRQGLPQISHDGGPFCNLKTNDAGKKCSDNSQCQGWCLAEGLDAEFGSCSEFEQLGDGCGWYEMENGQVRELCVS